LKQFDKISRSDGILVGTIAPPEPNIHIVYVG